MTYVLKHKKSGEEIEVFDATMDGARVPLAEKLLICLTSCRGNGVVGVLYDPTKTDKARRWDE